MAVSRNAHYGWLHRSPAAREQADAGLTPAIQAIFAKSRATYGTRRIGQSLLRQNLSVARGRIGRLVGAAGLACKAKRKVKAATDSKHDLPVAGNSLDRQFTAQKPGQVYVGDITHIHTKEGWLCLAVVIDLFSRQVVGWPMARHMCAPPVNGALLMAPWKRKPGKGLLWHSDRGSQCAAASRRKLIKHFGVRQGMGRKGDCREWLPLGYKAVSESFFHTLKAGLAHHRHYQARTEAKMEIFEYIERRPADTPGRGTDFCLAGQLPAACQGF